MELINLWIPVFLWILIGIVLVLMISQRPPRRSLDAETDPR